MIVVDTSVWIEFIRGSEHPAAGTLRDLIESRELLALTDVVVMELLAGEQTDEDAADLRTFLLTLDVLSIADLRDFEEAAALYRKCRQAGETIRRLTDCLIAVPTMRAKASIFHKDRDFDVIARHSDLRVFEA